MDDWIPDVSELDPLEDDEPSTNSKDDHPIPEHVFQFVEKKLQQVNLIKNLRRLPLPRKKKLDIRVGMLTVP